MSIYARENALFLKASLESMFNQTQLPEKIILVKDGPLNQELEDTLQKFLDAHSNRLMIVGYPQNKGLGFALNFGLDFVTTPYVARMDADDIAVPTRFEKQLAFMQQRPGLDVTGTYISEFDTNENVILRLRRVPLSHTDILLKAKLFNPMNHMTVFMKTDSLRKAGGYRHAPFFEDYDLWVRMLNLGMQFQNLPESLVLTRIGNDMVGKRHGFRYVRFEYDQFARMRELSFISTFQFYRALALRLPLRIIPKKLLAMFYSFALRKKSSE